MKRQISCYLGLLLTLFYAASAFADSLLWTGTSADQNWTTGANWTNATAGTAGVVPGASDSAGFFDSLSTTLSLTTDQTIASLRFGSTNNDYTITINSGAALNVNGGLRVGTPGDTGTAVIRAAAFLGTGGSLNLSNATANLVLNQGTATGVNGSQATLNLEGLDSFNADLNGLGIGTVHYENSVAQRNAGTLYLARTNLVILRSAQPLSVYTTVAAATNSLELVHTGSGNNAGARSFLYLGESNAFFVDSMAFGKSKSSTAAAATMMFNPNFLAASPVAYFRGLGGDQSRVTWWALGDMASDASSAQHAVGTNNFTGGRVDALVETLSLGRDCAPNHTASGSGRINTGVLTFDNGIIDVNTLIVGNQSLAQSGSASVTPNHGYVNINSANATLVVNNVLKLADTSDKTHTGAQQTFGRINVDGGTLRAHTVTIGANTTTNAIVSLANSAKLVLSNTLASAAKPLRTLSLSDSTFVFHLNGSSPVASVTNLFTAGGANTIEIGSSITFDSYPAQVALFKFLNLSNDVTGVGTHNFALGAMPPNLVGASLSNNTFNSSIDLYIPTDPRPVITAPPAGYSGAPGSTVLLSASVVGVAPLHYQWLRNGVVLTDSGNWSGTATDSLTINNAQPGDGGSYVLVITNAYGAATSAPPAVVTISAGNVAPSLTGPNDLSVIEGQAAVLSASAAGVPSPALQWFKNGVAMGGENGSTLTIANAQYPADEAVYSLRATNVVGVASNSATLTVLVPPGIATEPSPVTVPNGSPAAFAVVATGHPAPTYQWSKNNTAIPNATNAMLSFASTQPSDAGNYAVLISNAGGSTNSTTVRLTVTSTAVAITNLAPANGAVDLCYDTPLFLKFNTAPVLGSGTLRIYDSTDTLVDTLDLSLNEANNAQTRSIGGGTYYAYPVILRSNTAAIYPHLGVMTSNTTYYVLMDTGFFNDAGGASMIGISSPTVWRFTTKAVGPDPTLVSNVIVAADGSGDFVTVQGAIDWVPSPNTTPLTISIRKGVYEEINRIPTGKNFLTFLGEGYQESVITYANNNTFQLANAGTATRCMFYAAGNDTAFLNLVFQNSTPQGGSQAEALRVQGSRIIVDNCRLASYQDTVLVNTANTSAGYFNKCLIQGDTDFIWGSGIGFFDLCEVRALQRSGNAGGVYTQARTGDGVYGLVFRNCDLTKSVPAVTNNWSLGRDANTSGPYGNVAWLNCRMDNHILPAGWTDGGLADKSTLRFWEYQSKDISGTTLVDVSSRVSWSRQISAAESEAASDPTNVFSSVLWEPLLAPYVARQPASLTVLGGEEVTLSAAIGGIPQPVYQWYRGASPIAGATTDRLVILNAQAGDSGTYSLRVTNELGFVITSDAVLTVTAATRPVIAGVTRLADGNMQFSFTGGAGQPYRVWASTDLTAAPVTSTWTLLQSGSFGASPVVCQDLQATNAPRRFYLITVP